MAMSRAAPARAIGSVGTLSLMTVRTTVGAGVEGSATSLLRGPVLSSAGRALATAGSATRAISSTASKAVERCVRRWRADIRVPPGGCGIEPMEARYVRRWVVLHALRHAALCNPPQMAEGLSGAIARAVAAPRGRAR